MDVSTLAALTPRSQDCRAVTEHAPVLSEAARSESLPEAEIVARVWDALATISDPCMKLSGRDLSLRDMGLINRVCRRGAVIEVGVTFTDPLCKFAFRIVTAIEDIRASLPGITEVRVVPEYAPMWRESRLNDKARRLLGKSD